MNRTTENVEAATKAIRILLENQRCEDLPGRINGEVGVKTRVSYRDWADSLEGKNPTINRIEIKTNISGNDWEVDRWMQDFDKKCVRLAMMFNCQCWFEDFGSGCRNILEVHVSHA